MDFFDEQMYRMVIDKPDEDDKKGIYDQDDEFTIKMECGDW